MNPPSQRYAALFISMVVAIIVSVLALYDGADLEAMKLSLIWTGRLAFFVFLIPFFASPLRSLFKTDFTRLIMRWRRIAGISYGGIQVVHLCQIYWMFRITASQPVDDDMLYIGGFGLFLVMGMLVTSFDRATKAIGRKNWKILHKSGFYICSFIYFYDFVIEPIELGTSDEYVLYAALTLGAMILRTIVMIRPKRISKVGHSSAST